MSNYRLKIKHGWLHESGDNYLDLLRLLRPLIDQELSVVFYDMTTIRAAGHSTQEEDIRRFGMAKEGLIARQFMLGVVQTGDGLPIYHEVCVAVNTAESPNLLVTHAVELDSKAATTFRRNHARTTLHNQDVRTISKADFNNLKVNTPTVVFGDPPCQGFSTSNQTNRSKKNANNWLFKEYLRIVDEVKPDWVVFENVKGLVETESGYFLDAVLNGFKKQGYATRHFVLNSADFGVPQKRNRLFIVASLHGIEIEPPKKTVEKPVSVKELFETCQT